MLKWLYKILSWEGIAGMALCALAMLCLLCSSSPFRRCPPYTDINKCLERAANTERQYCNEQLDEMKERLNKYPYDEERRLPYYNRALYIHEQTKSTFEFIDSCKQLLHKCSECIPDAFACDGHNKDKHEATYNLLFSSKMTDGINSRINHIATLFIAQLDPPERKMMQDIIPINKNGKQTNIDDVFKNWRMGERKMVPTSSMIALLSAYEVLVGLSEHLILNQLYWESSSTGCNCCRDRAIAIPETSFAMPGEKVKAKISISSYEPYYNPEVRANIGSIVETKYGVATWRYRTEVLGMHTITGNIIQRTHRDTTYSAWSFQYMVIAPGISLQLDKANSCYLNIANPISVSAPGYDAEDLSLRGGMGWTITKTNAGHYNIMAKKQPANGYLFLDAKNREGVTSAIGSLKLRVKTLPTPKAIIGEDGLKAVPEDPDIDMPYKIKSYSFYLIKKRDNGVSGPYEIRGSGFANNEDADEAMRHIKTGDRIIATDIVAKDENGVEYEVPGTEMIW